MKFMRTYVALALVTLAALNAEAKRSRPADVPPVAKDGITYSAPHDQMGCVVATSEKTGQLFWFRQVYVVRYEVGLEKDVQDCFITGLRIEDRKLLITNEEGGQFELDLDNLSVKILRGNGVIDRTPKKTRTE
jgi:hypothetical protein